MKPFHNEVEIGPGVWLGEWLRHENSQAGLFKRKGFFPDQAKRVAAFRIGEASRMAAVLLLFVTSCSGTPGDVQPAGSASSAMPLQIASSYEVVVDSACASARRIVNSRFERFWTREATYVVAITEDAETGCFEGERGTVTATVWTDPPAAGPVAVISDGATRAALVDDWRFAVARRFEPLLRTTVVGCCGARDVDTYYSVRTGQRLFTANRPLLHFIANGTVRYIGVLSGGPEGPPSEAEWGSAVAAVVQYGDATGPMQQLRIPGDTAVEFSAGGMVLRGPNGRAGEVLLTAPGRDPADTVAVSGISLSIELRPIGDAERRTVTVRIEGDQLVLGGEAGLRRR